MTYNNIFEIESHILNTHYSFAGFAIYPHCKNWRVFDTIARLSDTITKTPAMIGAGFDAEIMVDGKIVKTIININRYSGDMYNGAWEVIEEIAE